jgi:hypothetical protein
MAPEVVLAASWRPKAEMASRFDSPTMILYRQSVGTFRLTLNDQSYKSVFIWMEIWHLA